MLRCGNISLQVLIRTGLSQVGKSQGKCTSVRGDLEILEKLRRFPKRSGKSGKNIQSNLGYTNRKGPPKTFV